MFFYSTGDYESEYGETLEHFAESIGSRHAECKYGEPSVRHLSLMLESEIAISKEGLSQFQERVKYYYYGAREEMADDRKYRAEQQPYSYM